MNKLLKTLIAGVSALTMCISVMPLSASAVNTDYIQGDINGDNKVLSSDLSTLRKFLNGELGASSGYVLQRLDVNQDSVIDENDYVLLKSILLGLSSNESKKYSSDLSTMEQENRTYYVYDAKTGNKKDNRTYTLSRVSNINTTSSTSNISTCDIIGSDERKLESGYNGIVRLTYSKGNSEGKCTGVVVDNHTILTVAHGMYDGDLEKGIRNLEILFYDETNHVTNFEVSPKEVHIPTSYINNYDDLNDFSFEKYDYALITVEQDLSNYINFNVGIASTYISANNYDFYSTGFANSYFDGTSGQFVNRKTTGSGKMRSVNKYNIYYTIDTSSGYSGAPIYLDVNGSKTIVGINTYGLYDHDYHSNYNHGTRITTDILHFIYNNNNLSY